MQSYLKYKRYYDKKATASILKISPKFESRNSINDVCLQRLPLDQTLLRRQSSVQQQLRGKKNRQRYTKIFAPNQRLPEVTVKPEVQISDLEVKTTHDDGYALGNPSSEKFCSETQHQSGLKKLQLQKSQ